MVDQEIRRLARLLEALVRVKKVPVRQLERRLSFGGGTMNRIFAGRIDLKIRHILLVLEDLDVKPAQFFQLAYETGTEEPRRSSSWKSSRGEASPNASSPSRRRLPRRIRISGTR